MRQLLLETLGPSVGATWGRDFSAIAPSLAATNYVPLLDDFQRGGSTQCRRKRLHSLVRHFGPSRSAFSVSEPAISSGVGRLFLAIPRLAPRSIGRWGCGGSGCPAFASSSRASNRRINLVQRFRKRGAALHGGGGIHLVRNWFAMAHRHYIGSSAPVYRPSREGVARHRVLVPVQPEPGPARADHTVNRQQPFGQNGACNVQIFEPGSRWRDGHHMRARLDKSVV
jgi:hypothetical protein